MPDARSAGIIAVAALVTVGLRFLPFWVFGGKREPPRMIRYLSTVLPAAVIAMLVVYCLREVSFASAEGWLPALIGCGVVTGLYLWRRSTLWSIIGGTVCYMLLVQLVFV